MFCLHINSISDVFRGLSVIIVCVYNKEQEDTY